MRDFGLLVVDGNSNTLHLIKRMFGLFKVNADCVLSAGEALEYLKSRDYKTMVIDLEMPDMDGFELVRRARELYPDLNVVLFTGNTSPYIQKLAIDAKVTEVHYKTSGLGSMLKSIIKREADKDLYVKQTEISHLLDNESYKSPYLTTGGD